MTKNTLLFFAVAALMLSPLASFGASSSATAASRPLPSAIGYEPQDEDERGLWLQMDEFERDLKNSKLLIKDPQLNTYVRGVLCRTVGAERCGAARIYIMRTPYFNASMAPNGVMMVWSGLLLRVRNEAELASVLGHEFGHFENQHSLQSFRDIRAKTDAIAWLSLVPGVGNLARFSIVGSLFKFNRQMEREADLISLDYMAANGYDPMAASTIWGQLRGEMDATAKARKQRSRKDMNFGFWATHPNTKERMEYLRKAAEKKGSVGFTDGAKKYRKAMTKWWPRLMDDQIKLNDFGATEFLLQQLASEGWTSDLLFARGELYRARAKKDDLVKAIGFYRQAIAKRDAKAEVWRGLGLALLRSGAKVEGRAALRKYLSRDPEADDNAMIALMAGSK
ncbi:MAG: M48 family metallopeptidase [Sphingorhabdus sp.]